MNGRSSHLFSVRLAAAAAGILRPHHPNRLKACRLKACLFPIDTGADEKQLALEKCTDIFSSVAQPTNACPLEMWHHLNLKWSTHDLCPQSSVSLANCCCGDWKLRHFQPQNTSPYSDIEATACCSTAVKPSGFPSSARDGALSALSLCCAFRRRHQSVHLQGPQL